MFSDRSVWQDLEGLVVETDLTTNIKYDKVTTNAREHYIHGIPSASDGQGN
jgi:hypothetical protein